MHEAIHPTEEEREARSRVLLALLSAISREETVKLPDFDRAFGAPGAAPAPQVGVEPNPFGATLGPYRYQFEGEEDLLHLIVARSDGGPIGPEEGRAVAEFVLEGVAPGCVWARHGLTTQHFYLGHDVLAESVTP